MARRVHVLIGIILALATTPAWAQESVEVAAADSVVVRPDLAILPFANNAGLSEVHTLLEPRLEQLLIENELTIVTSSELRPLLRRFRIRSRGWIGTTGARIIAAETGARYILIGSWDVLRREINPEVAFSMRVLDLETMTLVRAISVGATGEDDVGLLDRGRITDLEILVDLVLERAINELLPIPETPVVRYSSRGCNHVAVIPLDNESETAHAGEIMTNILLSRLLTGGYFVLEPGFVRELGLAREVVSRGGVDVATARDIAKTFRICRVITGTVSQLETARGDPRTSIPSLAVGLRVMSPEDGTIYSMEELEIAGNDHDGFFKIGRTHGLFALANELLGRFQKELSQSNREDILYGRNVIYHSR